MVEVEEVRASLLVGGLAEMLFRMGSTAPMRKEVLQNPIVGLKGRWRQGC